MAGRPDPKPASRKGNKPRRRVDQAAVRAAALADPTCAACGERGSNGHHVLPKDKGGDDDARNVVTLCGSGTSRCHGAHHGSPYVAESGERRDAAWVNARIGWRLAMRRPDTIEYIIEKLGQRAAAHFLLSTYSVRLVDLDEATAPADRMETT